MKFKKDTHFWIAKNTIDSTSSRDERMNYDKWVDFVDRYPDQFIWNENTQQGIETLASIDKVPEGFKHRVLASLNKVTCFSDFDGRKSLYNISCSFVLEANSVSISFKRTPRIEDLKIFLEMAKQLDALLLMDGKKILDEKLLGEF
ncbi:MAG: hypothetical protein H7Y13_16235 [Sphingobacteriaceae bacterium]|nr:hypothetical protein [Sphingobacteriaceae bacterium]